MKDSKPVCISFISTFSFLSSTFLLSFCRGFLPALCLSSFRTPFFLNPPPPPCLSQLFCCIEMNRFVIEAYSLYIRNTFHRTHRYSTDPSWSADQYINNPIISINKTRFMDVKLVSKIFIYKSPIKWKGD